MTGEPIKGWHRISDEVAGLQQGGEHLEASLKPQQPICLEVD